MTTHNRSVQLKILFFGTESICEVNAGDIQFFRRHAALTLDVARKREPPLFQDYRDIPMIITYEYVPHS